VLFVDHDQPQTRQRGQLGHARAQHDARLAQVRAQPGRQALGRRQPAVHRHHGAGAKALGKAGQQLGRQVDLGHQHQHLGRCVLRQGTCRRAQVHLGLATAGGAEQQKRPAAFVDARQRRGLLAGQGATVVGRGIF
jgi:hypothetical protein